MAESPHGQGKTPFTGARSGPRRAAPEQAPYQRRERSDRAIWGAASRRPELLCKSFFAHSTAPVWGGRRGPGSL
eukprot:2203445-Alexandrium_andersonii.AAC.1